MSFRLLAPARRELKQDATWYERQQAGLGERFLDAVRQAFQRIVDNPLSLPRDITKRRQRDIRRCEVRGFPYQVMIEIRSDELVVVAVAHSKRRPGYWSRRKR